MVVRLLNWACLDGDRLGVLDHLDLELVNVLVRASDLFEVLVAILVWSDLVRSDQDQENGEMVVHCDLSHVPCPLVVQGAMIRGIFGCEESECGLKRRRYVNPFGDGRFCCFGCI